MADVAITAVSVITGQSLFDSIRLGETVAVGDLYYRSATDQKAYKTDCTDAAKDNPEGILLTAGDEDEYASVLKFPRTDDEAASIDIGAVLVDGERYFLSENGKICPEPDLATDDFVTFVGVADSTSILALRKAVSGVQVP